MLHFAIKDIEKLSGIKATTLRLWEQQYKLFKAEAMPQKPRLYSQPTVQKILHIAFLYQQQMKMRDIAILADEAMKQKIQEYNIELENYTSYIILLLSAALDVDERRFTHIFDDLCNAIGFEKCIAEIAYPVLYTTQQLSPSDDIQALEQFARRLLQNKLITRTEALPAVPSLQPAVVLFTPDDKQNELPLLFINYLFKKYGWNTIYLGCNITTHILRQLQPSTPISYVYAHIKYAIAGWLMDDYLETLCAIFPHQKIIASGAATIAVQRQLVPVTILATDDALYRFIRHCPYLGDT